MIWEIAGSEAPCGTGHCTLTPTLSRERERGLLLLAGPSSYTEPVTNTVIL